MIPELIHYEGAPYAVLPPGVHPATLDEIEARFATNDLRRRLFGGVCQAAYELRMAGCGFLYLNGSFMTDKDEPNDFDACFDPRGVVPELLDSIFEDHENDSYLQRVRFGGEIHAGAEDLLGFQAVLKDFMTEPFTGHPKGVVKVKLKRNIQ
jgi:hypothetical protein